MADIRCCKCGEPFDADELHDWNDRSFDENLRAFRAEGCAALDMRCNDVPDHGAAMVASAAFDLMGDDIDGVAMMLEDAEAFGLL